MKIIKMVHGDQSAISFIFSKKRIDRFISNEFTLFQFWPQGAKSKKKVWWLSYGQKTPMYLSSLSWQTKFTFRSIRIGTTSSPKVLSERSKHEGTKNCGKLLSSRV